MKMKYAIAVKFNTVISYLVYEALKNDIFYLLNKNNLVFYDRPFIVTTAKGILGRMGKGKGKPVHKVVKLQHNYNVATFTLDSNTINIESQILSINNFIIDRFHFLTLISLPPFSPNNSSPKAKNISSLYDLDFPSFSSLSSSPTVHININKHIKKPTKRFIGPIPNYPNYNNITEDDNNY